MDINEQYNTDAARTLTGEFFGERVSYDLLIHRLQGVEVMGKAIDKMKRLLYYGVLPRDDEAGLPTVGDLPAQQAQILHGILGVMGEVAELASVAVAILHRKDIDEVNLIEEVGDILWYSTTIMGAMGRTLTDAENANIAKLQKRYPGKFTLHAALNRDLFAVRQVLENKTGEIRSYTDKGQICAE